MECDSVKFHLLVCQKCLNEITFAVIQEMARRAGSTTSKKKARASRRNGRKGGRPRK